MECNIFDIYFSSKVFYGLGIVFFCEKSGVANAEFKTVELLKL